jgi:ribonuclease HI
LCSTGKNIYIFSNYQAAIKALDSFQINSNLFWDSHQILVKLAECNTIQLVRVPGHMGINRNEMADELASQGS